MLDGLPVFTRPMGHTRCSRCHLDIWICFCLRILALLRKLLQIWRFFLRSLYRPLADLADTDRSGSYETCTVHLCTGELVLHWLDSYPDVEAGREQVPGEQFPLPPSGSTETSISLAF